MNNVLGIKQGRGVFCRRFGHAQKCEMSEQPQRKPRSNRSRDPLWLRPDAPVVGLTGARRSGADQRFLVFIMAQRQISSLFSRQKGARTDQGWPVIADQIGK